MNNNEIWKDLKGYEKYYKISNFGRLYSKRKNTIMTNLHHNCGYLKINLVKNKTMKSVYIHRLVAENFIANIENKPQVNHIDGNKLNNRVDNLEWCTAKENQSHSINVLKNKRYKIPIVYGENHHNSKKIKQIENGKTINTFFGCGEASRETGINKHNIWSVLKGNRKTAGGYFWQYV